MVLLDNVVQVWDGSMAAAAAKYPFFFDSRDGRGMGRCQIRIDDTAADAKGYSEPCEIAVWPHRHRVAPTAESQWWHRLNRSLDTDSTSGLSLLHKSRPHATTCWLVSDGGADGGPVPDHTAAPSAILSCGRLLNNVPRATLRHRATKASTEDTNGPHKESVEARSAAI